MIRSDVRLIDPAFGELATAVLKAARVANGRVRHDRIDKDVPAWHRSLRRVFLKPSGRVEWPSKYSPFGAPLVKAAWWTDPLGRKHWRLIGTRRTWPEFSSDRGLPLAKHDLWHVYPERLFWRKAGGREELVAACGCGVAGTPQAICWTGERCGPCHDRLEEGLPPAPQRPWRRERRRHTAMAHYVAWLSDGRMVTGGGDGRVVLWEEDGGSRVLLHRRGGYVHGLAASSAGLIAACTAAGRLLLLDVNREADWRTVDLGRGGYASPLSFSPDGEKLLVSLTTEVLLLDVAEPAPRPLLEGQPLAAAVFAGDEAACGFTRDGALLRVDLASGEVAPLREGPLARVDSWDEDGFDLYFDDFGDAPLLACSADGRWLVALGEWQGHHGPHRCHLPSGAWAPLPGGAPNGPNSLAFSGPDELMAVNSDDTVSVWSLADGALKATWYHVGQLGLGRTLLSPGGEWLVQPSPRGEVMLYPWGEVLRAAGGGE